MKLSDEVSHVNVSVLASVLGMVLAGPSLTSAAFAQQLHVRSGMLVSTAWLADHLGDSDLVLLSVGRNRGEYDAGHIPGAHFLALEELVEQYGDSLNDLPPVARLQAVFESLGVGDNTRVVLYGEGGGLLAARAYFTLDYLGLGDRTALLDGGMEKWSAEARPINRHPAYPSPSHFTPRVQDNILITTSRMQELVTAGPDISRELVLLDARPPREFDGSVMSEGVPRAGHLAGAKSLYWKTLLQAETIPILRENAELRREFAEAGADPRKLVVTYCRTGMQSSFTYFAAKYLGYRAAMYDGSVYEWVHRAGYDLVTSPESRPIRARK